MPAPMGSQAIFPTFDLNVKASGASTRGKGYLLSWEHVVAVGKP